MKILVAKIPRFKIFLIAQIPGIKKKPSFPPSNPLNLKEPYQPPYIETNHRHHKDKFKNGKKKGEEEKANAR